MKIIWNYDDIDLNILGVKIGDRTVGYFRLDIETFRLSIPGVSYAILKSIIDGYDEAKKEAEKLIKDLRLDA